MRPGDVGRHVPGNRHGSERGGRNLAEQSAPASVGHGAALSGTAPGGGGPEVDDDPKIFILSRELSEVHLLLDNISADPDNSISAMSAKDPPPGLTSDWIDQICQISWPPSNSEREKSAQASLLIRAKDYLNRLAKPASGATIAFTLLVTQDDDDKSKRRRRNKGGSDIDDTLSRSSLAEIAYPDLKPKAEKFRKIMWRINVLLVVWLVFTCFLSWYVAYGNAALSEYATFKAAVEKAQARVDNDEAGRRPPGEAAPTTATPAQPSANPVRPAVAGSDAPAAPVTTIAAAERNEPEVGYCNRWMLANPSSVNGLIRYENPEQLQACRNLQIAERQAAEGEQRLHKWLGPAWRWLLHVSGREGDASSIASRLTSVIGTAALPVLYGFLGAGAAVLRSLSRKIKLSTLSPRDLSLSLQQLALGAVIGACIGLFIAQPGKDSPLIGPVALSGSAISFIAGFGVEAVFQALEGLIARIFNVPSMAGQAKAETRPGS